jgi:hypothetical protein
VRDGEEEEEEEQGGRAEGQSRSGCWGRGGGRRVCGAGGFHADEFGRGDGADVARVAHLAPEGGAARHFDLSSIHCDL